MTDEKIIELFNKRDEQAIRECMTAYEAYCRTVAAGILADPADAEEAVADTWLTAWDTIPPQCPKHLRLYLGRITRNLAISRWRKNTAQCRGGGQVELALEELGECVSRSAIPEAELDARQLQRAISAFLKTEPAIRRQVFVRRYFYLEELPAIAYRFGLGEANVRMMLSRTRQKLRNYLIQEGYQP